MCISDCVRAALKKAKKTQLDLMRDWGVASRQAMNNKFQRGSWSANDLANIAEYTGGELSICYPDGEKIVILPESKPRLKGKNNEAETEG